MAKAEPSVTIEEMPNTNTMKFVLDRIVGGERSQSYGSPESATGNSMATRLFAIDGVEGLLVMENFILITKAGGISWSELVDPLARAIRAELALGSSAKLRRGVGNTPKGEDRVKRTLASHKYRGRGSSLRTRRMGVSAEIRWTVLWLIVAALVAQVVMLVWWSVTDRPPAYLIRVGATAGVLLLWLAFTESRE